MRLSRVIHAAEPGRTRPLAGKGGCTREPWGVGRGGGAGVPQSRLVVGAWAEHTWPLSYPPQRRLPLAGRAEVVEGKKVRGERANIFEILIWADGKEKQLLEKLLVLLMVW